MNNNLTDITIILDRSGSMACVKDDTIGGYSTFIKSQQELPGECLLSMVQFNDAVGTVYSAIPIKEVPTLAFEPCGTTALLDAIGQTIHVTGSRFEALEEATRPGKVMIVIITDGAENASKRYSRDRVFDMIAQQTTKYAWQFVFLGANQDAIAAGGSLGIGLDRSLTYASNSIGTRSAFVAVGKMSRSIRSEAAGHAVTFDWDDRQAQKDAGAN